MSPEGDEEREGSPFSPQILEADYGADWFRRLLRTARESDPLEALGRTNGRSGLSPLKS